MVEQVIVCAVWPMENWIGSSLNHIQGWTTVQESYCLALEQGPLLEIGVVIDLRGERKRDE